MEYQHRPNGTVVNFSAYGELIHSFGLSTDEARLVEIDLALEYGLLRCPQSKAGSDCPDNVRIWNQAAKGGARRTPA